jgi:hypothetical protein
LLRSAAFIFFSAEILWLQLPQFRFYDLGRFAIFARCGELLTFHRTATARRFELGSTDGKRWRIREIACRSTAYATRSSRPRCRMHKRKVKNSFQPTIYHYVE